MKVYMYNLNYRAVADTNPAWMGVAHTKDIQVASYWKYIHIYVFHKILSRLDFQNNTKHKKDDDSGGSRNSWGG